MKRTPHIKKRYFTRFSRIVDHSIMYLLTKDLYHVWEVQHNYYVKGFIVRKHG